jgi:ketosteroid isomerase-like protein
MKADELTTTAILAVMEQMSDAYRRRDMNALMAIIAPDPDVIMYGTGADEKRIAQNGIKRQAERDWSQTDEAAITLGWHSVSVARSGGVAWLAADAAFELKAGGQEMSLPARITATFENRNGSWLMVQSHFSFPAAGQEEGEAFPQEG